MFQASAVFQTLDAVFQALDTVFQTLGAVFEVLDAVFQALDTVFHTLGAVFEALDAVFLPVVSLRRKMNSRPDLHLYPLQRRHPLLYRPVDTVIGGPAF